MDYSVPRSVVTAFYEAYAARDGAKVAEFLHDDVMWTISGPVDLLPFCGVRHGKEAVRALIEKDVPAVFRVFSFVTDAALVDGDRVATLNRLAARHTDGSRVISYRLSHFLRFRDDKVTENVSLIDSFNAVEQVLGYPLAHHEGEPITGENMVAV
jgi:ketosteroid isomerase-like protein